MEWTVSGLKAAGFEGFIPFADLPLADVPNRADVYMVVRTNTVPPTFIESSIAGWFKAKDPTVATDKLIAKWLEQTPVLYIGKADLGRTGKRIIRKRLDEYRRHGAGNALVTGVVVIWGNWQITPNS